MKLGQQIAALLEAQNKTASDLARYVDVTPQAVGHWLRGDSEPIGKRRRAIAGFFGLTEEELLFGGAPSRGPRSVPVLNWEQAGGYKTIVDNDGADLQGVEYLDVGVPVMRQTFALEVEGDSMINPAGWPSFPAGSRIVVEPSLEPQAGDFVVVRRAGVARATLKQLAADAGVRYLKSLNPIYPLLELRADDQIVGVVREVTARLR
jgi:SOS-response transcriptional repressor LexA